MAAAYQPVSFGMVTCARVENAENMGFAPPYSNAEAAVNLGKWRVTAYILCMSQRAIRFVNSAPFPQQSDESIS
ncbi:MAG: hypothetical protein NTV73_06175 [Hyphomicrobiales bacterium]|nr:hypothetical protein [Hyphomicrobiales bacterium]